jgi:hypothetical protein
MFNVFVGISLKYLMNINYHLGYFYDSTVLKPKIKNCSWFSGCLLGKYGLYPILNLHITIFLFKKNLNLVSCILSNGGELLLLYGNRDHDASSFMHYLSNKFTINNSMKIDYLDFTFFSKRRYHYCIGWIGGIISNWRKLYWRSKLIKKYRFIKKLKNEHLWVGIYSMYFLPSIAWVIHYYNYGIKEGICSSIPIISSIDMNNNIKDLFYYIPSHTYDYWDLIFYTILMKEFVFFSYLSKWKNNF